MSVMRTLAVVLLLVSGTALHAQTDYFGGMDLRDGIYTDFFAFKNNQPSVPLEKLRDAQGLPVNDARRVSGKLNWQPDSGASQTVDLNSIWGFCQNDVVYIGTSNGFYRIGLMGSLGHMVYEVTYRDWDPYMDPYGGVTRTALAHLLLDMNTGAFLDFNAGSMAEALKADPVLLEEFLAVPKKERNKDATLFRFLRFYNERHPLLFPQ